MLPGPRQAARPHPCTVVLAAARASSASAGERDRERLRLPSRDAVRRCLDNRPARLRIDISWRCRSWVAPSHVSRVCRLSRAVSGRCGQDAVGVGEFVDVSGFTCQRQEGTQGTAGGCVVVVDLPAEQVREVGMGGGDGVEGARAALAHER